MEITQIISGMVDRLQTVAGLEAIVLGGSRARGSHNETSDIDLGLYYYPAAPLDLAALGRAASEIDDDHRVNLVTGIGGWGPWINGGGWLTVNQTPVDLLYRDLDRVSQIISACQNGRIEIAYQPGHPHAFTSAIYLSEIALCQPLWDPHGTVARLKEQAQPYPPLLKRAIVDAFWWEVDFSLKNGHKAASRGDVAYAAGCCFRAVICLSQTLFALNEQYWMNEKGAVALAAGFPIAPTNLKERVAQAFEQLNHAPLAIEATIGVLEDLMEECRLWVE